MRCFLIYLISLFLHESVAQNTVQLPPGEKPPPAQISDVAWISGNWGGEALGGKIEEIWSGPAAGAMMCTFRLVVNEKVKFYEICTISEKDSSLLLRIKHFDDTLRGWEEKDKAVEFRLVKLESDRAFFEGFTFEKSGGDKLNVYVVIHGKDGKQEEVKFAYRKQ